jgi:hypothetical protein
MSAVVLNVMMKSATFFIVIITVVMLSGITQSDVKLSVAMLIVIMQSVVMLSVIMLSVALLYQMISGLYYKHVPIVNDASSGVNK